MTRRELREHCFKMLFEAMFYPTEEVKGQFENYFLTPIEEETRPDGEPEFIHSVELNEEDSDELKARAEKINALLEEIDREINRVTLGWSTKRMSRVDLTILRLAIYEMRYDEEIPEKVAINEAVELAKKFGGKDSPAFVNGVLAKLVKERS